MPCYSPLQGYMSRKLTPNGKRQITFKPSEGYIDMPMTVPCGQCIGCKLEKSKQWAIRCVHEASMHQNNAFITLTYDNVHLPLNNSLDKRELQLFMKRLRKAYGEGVRFYGAGEYGEKFERPHFHIILFNINFTDKEIFQVRNNVKLYRSPSLEKLWTNGFSTIGDVTFESAAYVARYVTKKITGDSSIEHYKGRQPEFALMSRRPGIGKSWIEKYWGDVYVQDQIIIRGGKQMKPPAYYDNIYDKITGNLTKIKLKRKLKILEHMKDNTDERRIERLESQKLKFKKLKRRLETNES